MPYDILVLNPGSTSTKASVYRDEHPLMSRSVVHTNQDLAPYPALNDQLDYRVGMVRSWLALEGYDLSQLSAVVGRGGIIPNIVSGGYLVDSALADCLLHHTVFDHAWPQTPEETAYLAEGLRDFTVINGISTAEEYGQIIADRMEVSPELAEFLDLRRLGQRQIDEEGGEFGDRGYVAYKGTQPEIKEILGRHIPPTQEEIGPVMC